MLDKIGLGSLLASLLAIFVFLALPTHPQAAEPDGGSEAGASATSDPTPSGAGQPTVTGIARLGGGFPEIGRVELGVSFDRLAVRLGFGNGHYDPLVLAGKFGYRAPIFDTRGDEGRGFTFALPILFSSHTSVGGDIDRVLIGTEVELDLRYWLSEHVGLNATGSIGAGQAFGNYGVGTHGGGRTGGSSLNLGPPLPTGGFAIGVLF